MKSAMEGEISMLRAANKQLVFQEQRQRFINNELRAEIAKAKLEGFFAGARHAAAIASGFSTRPDRSLHPDIPWLRMKEGVQIAAHSTAQQISEQILADINTRTSLPEEKP